MLIELSVFHVFTLTQNVTQRPERRTVVSVLALRHEIRHNIRTRKPVSVLQLTQAIQLRTSVYNLSVTSSLRFSQTISKQSIELSVNHYLFHWQTVKRPKWEKLTSFYNPTSGIVGNGCKAVKNTLTLSQTIVGSVVRPRTVTSTYGPVSGVAGWLSNANFNFLNPVYTINERVTFAYNGYQISLRKPDFDDTYVYELTRINRRSRGGDLLISRDGIWPSTKTLNLQFSALSQEEVDNLLNFFHMTLGKRCTYTNYDNVTWSGFIINPQTPARQMGRLNHRISIEFQGEPV